MMSSKNLWRIHIKPDSKNGKNAREFCIKNNILGIGWSVDCESNDWSEYYSKALDKYYKENSCNEIKKSAVSWWKAINAIHNIMNIGDLCWTKDENDIYYLGKVVGDWQYNGDEEHLEFDIVNLRKCIWIKIGTSDEIPCKIRKSFMGSTIQRILDNELLQYSESLYNKI